MDGSAVVVRPLADPHNKLIRTVRRLQSSRAARERLGRTVLEGPRLVEEALARRIPLPTVVYSPRLLQSAAGSALVTRLSGGDRRLVYVTDELMDSLSGVEHTQGILAVAAVTVPTAPLPPVVGEPGLWVVADGLQDPGNLGTLIRSAAGAGAHAVGLTAGTVDPLNPKVLRASAGGWFRTAVQWLPPAGDWLPAPDTVVYAAHPHRGQPYFTLDWRGPVVVWLGNEARGGSATGPTVVPVRIPLAKGLESLNVAMAATVLLFHAAAQRGTGRAAD